MHQGKRYLVSDVTETTIKWKQWKELRSSERRHQLSVRVHTLKCRCMGECIKFGILGVSHAPPPKSATGITHFLEGIQAPDLHMANTPRVYA